MSIEVCEKIEDLRKAVAKWRQAGESVALVPTMGALHEGHLSLVRLANEKADRTVVSIFVNPAQFAPHEDFDSYPRERDDDLQKLSAFKTDLVFAPPRSEVYPDGFATSVEVSGLTDALCGKSRPHFFGGVATVVAKLLNQCQADYAIFGEKDYQQLLVITRMARDLDINTEILGGPIVRETDGLAMSSRNAYLSGDERKLAPLLNAKMLETVDALRGGAEAKTALEQAITKLTKDGFRVDYYELRDADTLEATEDAKAGRARLFAAAYLGETRLIDNIAV